MNNLDFLLKLSEKGLIWIDCVNKLKIKYKESNEDIFIEVYDSDAWNNKTLHFSKNGNFIDDC